MRIVQKYGGSSVRDDQRIKQVANKIAQAYHDHQEVVVVLSAQGDMTNRLLAMAAQLNPDASQRELDMLLATGEQQSVALMSIALSASGIPSVSLNAWQAGIESDNRYGHARITQINSQRIERELAKQHVVLITGFQAVNQQDDFTTLGRGGSDTSAVAMACALNADRCEIYSDVDGVYTADPRLIPEAFRLQAVDYDCMLELASMGAKVLHNRAVELARKFNIILYLNSSFTESEGTLVQHHPMEQTQVSGVVVNQNIAVISLIGLPDTPGVAYQVFAALAKQEISIDIILQSVGRDRTKDMVFTIASADAKRACQQLQKTVTQLGQGHVAVNEDMAKVSVVGAGLEANPQIGADVFETLFEADVNIDMIATSEIKLSFIVDKGKATEAARLLHARLMPYFQELL